MARGYKRLTRKARHIIRHLPRIKFAAVQDQAIHELKHEVSRTHGFKGPKKGPSAATAGHWRPLTRKAKKILGRLRKAKVWSMQKQLVNELAKEIERGKRAAERVKRAAAAARGRGRQARQAVNRGQEKLLTRAERKQAQRGPRKPGRFRQSVRSARDNTRRRLRARRPRRQAPAPLRPRPARAQNRIPRAPRPPRPRPARTPRPRPARTR